MVLCGNAHSGVCRRGVLRADVHRGGSRMDDIIGLAVKDDRIGDRTAREAEVIRVLLLIQYERGDELRRCTGQRDDCVRGNVRDVDVRSADGCGGGARGDGGAKPGQPACVVREGLVVFTVIAGRNDLAVIHEIHLEAIPMLARLVVIPGARSCAGGVRVAVVAVVEMRRVERNGGLGAVALHLVDGGACGGSGREDDLAVAAFGAQGAGDISSSIGCEERASDRYGAVDVQQGVLEGRRRADGRGAVGDGVADGVHPCRTREVEPIVVIVKVYLLAARYLERRVPFDGDLHAGQRFDILRDRGRAAFKLDAHIAGDRQDIIARADRADHRDAGNCH